MKAISETILFYRVDDPYGELSNFSKHGFWVDGVRWRTVEHYFQAQKFHDDELRNTMRNVISPMEVANMGRDRRHPLREDWESVKDDVMRFAVLEKFKQNDNAREVLLATGNRQLIEHTKNDNYWADGGDGTGKNMLGIILMETRKNLSKNP
ncbi:NADAR family protein [Serratia fonticola]|nr:NADAR family protein [Serratia fonticola]MBL5861397.1 NADAR family protein [Serratia fonticola]MBL5904829.1 NADAR family protein [Serratia fonticola]